MDYLYVFSMNTYPILACVWCTCMSYFMYDVSDMVKGGSRSHLLQDLHNTPLLAIVYLV